MYISDFFPVRLQLSRKFCGVHCAHEDCADCRLGILGLIIKTNLIIFEK